MIGPGFGDAVLELTLRPLLIVVSVALVAAFILGAVIF